LVSVRNMFQLLGYQGRSEMLSSTYIPIYCSYFNELSYLVGLGRARKFRARAGLELYTLGLGQAPNPGPFGLGLLAYIFSKIAENCDHNIDP
jgi:hypothetical protein